MSFQKFDEEIPPQQDDQEEHQELSIYGINQVMDHSRIAIRKLLLVATICLIFMMVEIAGGYIANSLAIMTDAAHLFSDISGFFISIASLMIGQIQATEQMSYGYYRAEIVGAMSSVILIWGLTIWLVYEAIGRVVRPEEVQAKIMLITACLGLLFNLVMMKVLHGSGHSHSHAHDSGHDHEVQINKKVDDQAHIDSDGHNHHQHNHSQHDHHDHDHHDHHEHENHQHENHQHDHTQFNDNKNDMKNIKNETKNTKIEQHDKNLDDSQLPTDQANNGHKHTHDHDHSQNHEIFDQNNMAQAINNQAQINQNQHDHQGPDGNDHIHDHSHENMNLRAALVHLIGDTVQSVGVIIAAVIIFYKPDWHLVDPICTFLFSIIVVLTTVPITKDCIAILMESTPKHINYQQFMAELLAIPNVQSIHDLHIWSITSSKISLSAHIRTTTPSNTLKIAQIICQKYKIFHSTIQVENPNDNLIFDSQQCEQKPCL